MSGRGEQGHSPWCNGLTEKDQPGLWETATLSKTTLLLYREEKPRRGSRRPLSSNNPIFFDECVC